MPQSLYYDTRDGLTLHAMRDGGPGMPVLCLHGLTRNHRDFGPLISALGPHFDFIAADQRGRGLSARDPDPKRYRPDVYVQDMLQLLDHLGLKKVAIVGTSMGGLMAMLMAALAPDRLIGVVMNDIGPRLEPEGIQRITSYVGGAPPVATWSEAAARAAATQGSAFPNFGPADWEAFARRTCAERDGAIHLDYDFRIADSLATTASAGAAPATEVWPLFAAMHRFPLLVVRGGLSDLFSAATAERMTTEHPDASLVTVPDVGHAPILDEPACLEPIRAFLTRLEASA